MSLVSTFVDAFKKAAGKRPAKSGKDMRTDGPLGSTTEEAGKSFAPVRPTPEAGSGQRIDPGEVSVGSADPDEGGESSVRHDPPIDEERR
jgi:hypothetical protein